MVTFSEDTITITIKDREPANRREWLIRAIAAAIRWRANNHEGEVYTRDGENLYTLAQLLEQLVMDE